MKTFSAKSQDVERKWYVIDAADQIVGRVAVRAADILRGKHKPIYTPHADTGDFVVIINADKAIFTGNKETQKIYTSYSGPRWPTARASWSWTCGAARTSPGSRSSPGSRRW